MPKYKCGLYCSSCGQQIMTKMQMINDILTWTGQKKKSTYSNAELTSEQLFHVWKFVHDNLRKK